MESAEILVSGGVAAILASVVGGGLKAFGVELPLLATVKRQVLAAAAGAGLIGVGLVANVNGPATASVDAKSTTSSPQADAISPPSGPPQAPDVLGGNFPEARRLIIDAGWSPILQEPNPLENPALGTRGEEVDKTGWREVESCGGSGRAACLLRYRQRGHVLEVVVVGETLESGVVDMYDVLGCAARPRPEGCPEE